jgi:hypothetical protein
MSDDEIKQVVSLEYRREDFEAGRFPGLLLTQPCPCGHMKCIEGASKFVMSAGPSIDLRDHFAVVVISPHGNVMDLMVVDSMEEAIEGLGIHCQSLINLGYTVDRVMVNGEGWEILE